MVKLRPLRMEDVIKLDELWKEHWSHESSLPGLDNRIIDAVAVDDTGRIVGYGQIRHFAEAMMFLDPTCRKRDRAQATQLLMLEGFRGTEKAGLNELYMFTTNPDFSLLVQSHFKFEKVDFPGELLLRRL